MIMSRHQREFAFEAPSTATYEQNKLAGPKATPYHEDWQAALLKIFRSYRRKFGDAQGLSDRELDLAEIAAQRMMTETLGEPQWGLDPEGVSEIRFVKRIPSRQLPPLLRGLDKLMDCRYQEKADEHED